MTFSFIIYFKKIIFIKTYTFIFKQQFMWPMLLKIIFTVLIFQTTKLIFQLNYVFFINII